MLKNHPWALWGAFIATGVILERKALQIPESKSTLSHVTRWVFHTHTPEGRVAFLIAWGALTAWFLPHIVKTPAKRVEIV